MSVVSTNKTDRHDITGILLKVALNTINLTHILLTIYKMYIDYMSRQLETDLIFSVLLLAMVKN